MCEDVSAARRQVPGDRTCAVRARTLVGGGFMDVRDRMHPRHRSLTGVMARLILIGVAVTVALVPAFFGQTGALAQMQMPKETATTKILLPTDGQVVTQGAVAVVPEFTNWKQNCNLAGAAVTAGTGHYHVYFDGALVNMFCGPAEVSMQNVKPGTHTISVVPAENDHAEVDSAKASVKIDYEPAAALPRISSGPLGKPSIHVIYPKNGATVTGGFPLVITANNFLLSCDLYGKPKVTNAGHWHVNVDTMKGPMMGMATMLGMSCANYLNISTAGISKGKHTFYAFLVDTLHEPLMPEIMDKVTLNVQ